MDANRDGDAESSVRAAGVHERSTWGRFVCGVGYGAAGLILAAASATLVLQNAAGWDWLPVFVQSGALLAGATSFVFTKQSVAAEERRRLLAVKVERQLRDADERSRQLEEADRIFFQGVDAVLRERQLQSAVVRALKILAPSVRGGFAAFYRVRDGRIDLAAERGLSTAGREPALLDGELIDRVRRDAVVAVSNEELRRTEFVRRLSGPALQKMWTLDLFRIGADDSDFAVVAVSRPAPSAGEASRPNSRRFLHHVGARLAALLKSAAEAADEQGRRAMAGLRTTLNRRDVGVNLAAVPQALHQLRRLLQVDRASLFLRPIVGAAAGEWLPACSDSATLPPGVAGAWSRRELQLLAGDSTDGLHLFERDALAGRGVVSLISSAAVLQHPVGGGCRFALVVSHRIGWNPSPTERRFITGCGECLAELLSEHGGSTSAATPSDGDASARAAREEFLATVSHELRTPVAGILGAAELALATKLDGEQREYLDIVRTSSTSMIELLNGVLDLSRLEAKQTPLENTRLALRDLLCDCLRPLACRAHENQLDVCLRVEPDVPDDLLGDPLRLRQVLNNLVGNAVKYTETGEIVVDVRSVDRGAKRIALQFQVSDTGRGVPPEARERIFARYSQSDASDARNFGGTGLGLAICRELVALWGGELTLESEVGKGSRFQFTAVFEPADSDSPPEDRRSAPPADRRLIGVDVCVCVEHPATRGTLVETVESCGARTTVAESAPAAIRRIEALPLEESSHVVLLTDAHLPGAESVVEAARRRFPASRLRIVGLSAVGRPGGAPRDCFDRLVAKPIHPTELIDAVSQPNRPDGPGTRHEPPATDDARGGTSTGCSILVADDDPVARQVATRVLESAGHRVTAVEDGRQAVSSASRRPFDLILLDMRMPGMTGLEAASAIRSSSETGNPLTPIILLTAGVAAEFPAGVEHRLRELQIDGCCTKPLTTGELQKLLSRLEAAGRMKRGAGRSDAAAGDPPSTPPNESATPGRSDRLTSLFRETATVQLQKIAAGLSGSDFSAVEEAAHAVKGGAACLGMVPLEDALCRLENAAAAGERTAAEDALAEVERWLAELAFQDG